MAIYHLSAKVVSRGKGQSAIAAAAYRSGDPLVDERTGELKSYQQRSLRIIHKEIMAPAHAPEWARDRNALWNAAERAEKRKDAQLAREIEVSLPHELTEQQRLYLVKDFAREAFVRRGYAVDISIHTPDRSADDRNHHAHLMITMRVLGPDGFSLTKDRSLNSPEQLKAWREQWANLANRHLTRHGHDARIDHRSLEAQGMDREATTHVGYAGSEIAARGGQSDRMDELSGILERNGIRTELRAADAELAELRELVANENRPDRVAPEPKRGARPMLDGPTDDELNKQPERVKEYVGHLQTRHDRAQEVLVEQQRAKELDDRAKAFQQRTELEAEEGRKKQGEQDAAEARAGRNGDISSASARYSIALGQTYDVRDPYASLAKTAGAESAMFHKTQEQLRADAAKEADPDKRQAIELRRKIEGCDYMAVTSDRLAGISEVVTGKPDNDYAVKDREQAAHWRARAEALREERMAVLDKVQVKETAKEADKEAARQKELERKADRDNAVATREPRPRADSARPYRQAMPARVPDIKLAQAAGPSPEKRSERATPAPLPVTEPAAKIAEVTPAPQQQEPPRQPARLGAQPFAATAARPYGVTMGYPTEPPRPGPIRPFDTGPSPSSPTPTSPRPPVSPTPGRQATQQFVEASAESYAAAKRDGVSMRRVATPTSEATNSQGVTKAVEVTDRKAIAAGVQHGVVRSMTGVDRTHGHGREREQENERGGRSR